MLTTRFLLREVTYSYYPHRPGTPAHGGRRGGLHRDPLPAAGGGVGRDRGVGAGARGERIHRCN